MRHNKLGRVLIAILTLTVTAFSGCGINVDTDVAKKELTRETAGIEYQMDLSSLFSSDKEYLKTVEESNKKIDEMKLQVENLNSKEEFRDFCNELVNLSINLDSVEIYAMLKESIEQANPKVKELTSVSENLRMKFDELHNDAVNQMESKFNIDNFLQTEYYKNNQSAFDILADAIVAKSIYKNKPTDEIEDAVAQTSLIYGSFEEIYSTLTIGENPDEEGSNQSIINSVSSILVGEMKKNLFIAKLYGYDSVLELNLQEDEVPLETFNSLISSTNENIKYYKRYSELENVFYELEEAMNQDGKSIINDKESNYEYEEATKIISESLKVLGEDYSDVFEKEINQRWVDVYPGKTKTDGAYQTMGYKGNPYIMINYENDFNSVLELAHESGHAVEGYLSRENQDYCNYSSTIFKTEVASTANEIFVNEYMLKNAKTPIEKLRITEGLLTTMTSTTYDQVMNAEFEARLYSMLENGKPLSADTISEVWVEMLEKYWGKEYKEEIKAYRLDWSTIPHFYDAFYTYQYATSISAANHVAKSILSGSDSDLKSYIEFLKSGSSLGNMETMKLIGVDMTEKATFDNVYKDIDKLNKEMEKLLRVVGKDYPEIIEKLN